MLSSLTFFGVDTVLSKTLYLTKSCKSLHLQKTLHLKDTSHTPFTPPELDRRLVFGNTWAEMTNEMQKFFKVREIISTSFKAILSQFSEHELLSVRKSLADFEEKEMDWIDNFIEVFNFSKIIAARLESGIDLMHSQDYAAAHEAAGLLEELLYTEDVESCTLDTFDVFAADFTRKIVEFSAKIKKFDW